MKDARNQREGVCPVWNFFRQGRWGFQMRTSALFGKKKFRFFGNLW